MKHVFASILIALLLPVVAQAETQEYTLVNVTNGTNHFIYIDTYEHHGLLRHWGMYAPMSVAELQMKMPGMKFFTDVHVYVKKTRNSDADNTLCHVMRTFGNTTGRPTINVHVHYNGHTCSIDNA